MPRVLIVEDDFLVRLMLSESLAEAGYDVVEAPDGETAAALIDGPNGFDLVLTDLQMPGAMDGLGVARHARGRTPAIPVLYMTGRPDALGRVGLGPRDAFVRKPYAPSEILRTMDKLLQAARG